VKALTGPIYRNGLEKSKRERGDPADSSIGAGLFTIARVSIPRHEIKEKIVAFFWKGEGSEKKKE